MSTKILALLRGEKPDMTEVYKECEVVIRSVAQGRKLHNEDLMDLRSDLLVALMDKKPEGDPHSYLMRTAKNLVRSVSYVNMVSMEECDELEGGREVSRTYNLDHVACVINNSSIHPDIKRSFLDVAQEMPEDSLLTATRGSTVLGAMIAASRFSKIGTVFGNVSQHLRSGLSPLPDGLGHTSREQEVLLGVILAKIAKKSTIPMVVLMGDDMFLLSLYLHLGQHCFGIKKFLENIHVAVRVHCYKEKLLSRVSEALAVKICSRRFRLRQRDIITKCKHVERLLGRYDTFCKTWAKQFARDAASVARSHSFSLRVLRASKQKGSSTR